jgi:colicin import membrane protein
METTADKWRAFLFAIGVHLLCVALMFVGLLWTSTSKPISVAGSVMEATLVSTAPESASTSQPQPAPPKPAPAQPEPEEAAPPPQPKPEPRPEQAIEKPQPAPQAPLPDPDVVEREKAALLAQQQAEEKALKEEEARRKQEQIDLDEQQREEAERREHLTQMQQEQAKQLADLKKRREAAEQRRKLEEARLQQLADARNASTPAPTPSQPAPPADRLGNNGTDDSELGRYVLAIQRAVQSNWSRPDSAQPGIRCTLRIVQIPGGEVIQVSVTSPCNADDLTRRSIEAAVLKAQPLPYRGYEAVFQRDIRFNFRYDG